MQVFKGLKSGFGFKGTRCSFKTNAPSLTNELVFHQ